MHNIRQSIVTKYLGPTNYRGSRIKAVAAAKSITVSYDCGLSTDENHQSAAEQLSKSLGWDKYNDYVAGSLPDQTGYHYVFVAIDKKKGKKKHA